MVFLKATSSYRSSNSSVLDFRSGERLMVVDFGAVEGYARVISKRGKIGYVPLTGDRLAYEVQTTKESEENFIDKIISNMQLSREGDAIKENLKLLRDLYKLRFLIAAYGTNWSQKVSIKGTRFSKPKKCPLASKNTQTEQIGCCEISADSSVTGNDSEKRKKSLTDEILVKRVTSSSGDCSTANSVPDKTSTFKTRTKNPKTAEAIFREVRYLKYRWKLERVNLRKRMSRRMTKSRKKLEKKPANRKEWTETRSAATRLKYPCARTDRKPFLRKESPPCVLDEGDVSTLPDRSNESRPSIFGWRSIDKTKGCSIEDLCKQLQNSLIADPVKDIRGLIERHSLDSSTVNEYYFSTQPGERSSWCNDNSWLQGRMAPEKQQSMVAQQKRLFLSASSAVSPKLKQKDDDFVIKFLKELREFIQILDMSQYRDIFSKQGERIANIMVRYYAEERRDHIKSLLLSVMKDLCTKNPSFKNDICRTNLPWILMDDIRGQSQTNCLSIDAKVSSTSMFVTLLSLPQAALFLMNYVDEHFLTCLVLTIIGSSEESTGHRHNGTKLVATSLDLLLTLTYYSKFAVLLPQVVAKNNCTDEFLSQLLTLMFLNRGVEGVLGPSASLLKKLLELSSRTGFEISSSQLEDAFEVIVHYISTTSVIEKDCISWCLDTLLLLLMSPCFKGNAHHWKNADHFLNRVEEFEGLLTYQDTEKLDSLKMLIQIKKAEEFKRASKQFNELPKVVRSDSTVQKKTKPPDDRCCAVRYSPTATCYKTLYTNGLFDVKSRCVKKSVSSTAVFKF